MTTLVVWRPQQQRECEEILGHARTLLADKNTVSVQGLTITSEVELHPDHPDLPDHDKSTTVLTITRDENCEMLMNAVWDASDLPPLFLMYRGGWWRWVLRRAVEADNARVA
jgi:hypothetical protein